MGHASTSLVLGGIVAACVAVLAARFAAAKVIAARARRARARAVACQDDLVQGVQGLVLQLQAIAESLPPQAPPRAALEHVMDRADALLAAARARETSAD